MGLYEGKVKWTCGGYFVSSLSRKQSVSALSIALVITVTLIKIVIIHV